MASSILEQRMARLETQVAQLQSELQTVKRGGKDWRRTIGMFTDDEGMKAIFKEALKLREADRKKARTRTTAKGRKPKR
jgi:predicted  nucleic acid-binding Zn-ribbon protein